MINQPTVQSSNWNFRDLHPQISLARIRLRLRLCPALLMFCVGVDGGYLVELHAGDLIFLKVNHVADALEFDKYLYSRTLHPIYDTHLSHNLSGGRGYVHVQENRIMGERTLRTPSLLNGYHPSYPESTTSVSPSTI